MTLIVMELIEDSEEVLEMKKPYPKTDKYALYICTINIYKEQTERPRAKKRNMLTGLCNNKV